MAQRRVGLWLIGAFGGVGATVALGVAALKRGLTDRTGLVTASPVAELLDLDDPAEFIIGGHDIRRGCLATSAARVGGHQAVFPAALIDACRPTLDEWSRNVVSGSAINIDAATGAINETAVEELPVAFLRRFAENIEAFQVANGLHDVVVINLASTEPPATPHPAHHDLSQLNFAVRNDDAAALPLSSWYAYAALRAGRPYINFTPSPGASLPVLTRFAEAQKLPIAGQDGKTGETLVKTVLAPMFKARNLRVLSWVGHNILGNGDGRTLADPTNKASKLKSKDQVLAGILGYAPQSLTTIEYVESLDDWKTAWDHIHFAGFLGARMTLQFTWQGCDSALAAPLVLDLARLTLFARRRGESGVLRHLAGFFKSPMGVAINDLFQQQAMLDQYLSAAIEQRTTDKR